MQEYLVSLHIFLNSKLTFNFFEFKPQYSPENMHILKLKYLNHYKITKHKLKACTITLK